MRVAVARRADRAIVAEGLFEPGANLTLGAGPEASLVVPGWTGAPLTLVTGGPLLHLASGMSLHMCDENGEHRVKGTFRDLARRGISSPILLTVAKVNLDIGNGVSVFIKFIPAEAE
jgi:hypothetical protein